MRDVNHQLDPRADHEVQSVARTSEHQHKTQREEDARVEAKLHKLLNYIYYMENMSNCPHQHHPSCHGHHQHVDNVYRHKRK